MILSRLVAGGVREDSYGSGRFGAPRGGRLHRGTDYSSYVGEAVLSPCDGFVKRIGYPYANDEYRLIEIAADFPIIIRVFYVNPVVSAGDRIYVGNVIGRTQDLTKRYPANNFHREPITPHIHVEVKLIPRESFLVGRGEISNEMVWQNPELLIGV